MKDFNNKVAVITGGASGLGREFARKAATLGMKLVLADVQSDALDATINELTGAGADVFGQLCDVRHGAQVQALADAAMARYGAVHLVFNNAGVASAGLVWESTEADWEWVLGVNVWGVIHGVRIFTRLMLQQAGAVAGFEGHIVNTASMAGVVNPPAMGVYNASKHAVVSISESLYHDLQLVGAPIGASVLCPHFVQTGINHSERNRPADVKMTAKPCASQLAAQVLIDKAVASSKVTSSQVAETTFAAIARGQFYIYSHPEAIAGLRTRMEDMTTPRNPSDPHQATPQVRAALESMLKAGRNG